MHTGQQHALRLIPPTGPHALTHDKVPLLERSWALSTNGLWKMNGLLGDDREAARLREALGKPPHQRADMEVKEVQEFLASLVLLRGLPSAALAQWAQAAHYGRVQEEAGDCDRLA